MFKSSFSFLLLFCFSHRITSQDCPNDVQITVDNYYPKVDFEILENSREDRDEQTILYKEPVNLVLVCRSRQPIIWDFGNETKLNQYRFIRPKRTSEDPMDNLTFCFEQTLFLYRQKNATGKYTCRMILDEGKKSSHFVYIQDFSRDPFIDADPFKTVETPQITNQWLLVPCKVFNPDVTVRLILPNDKVANLKNQNAIKWNPKEGFRINIEYFSSYEGVYKCQALGNYSGEDRISIKQRDFFSAMPNISLYPAPNLDVVCEVPKDTELRGLIYKTCSNIIECWNTRVIPTKGAISQISSQSISRIKPPAIDQNNYPSGIIQCDAGINAFAPTHSSVMYRFHESGGRSSCLTPENVTNLYSHDNYPFNSTVLLWVGKIPRKLYVNQEITFQCEASAYILAEGIDWTFVMGNDTILTKRQVNFSESYRLDNVRIGFTFTSMMTVRLWSTDIHQIRCMAPLWTNFNWIHISKNIVVREGRAPTFQNEDSNMEKLTIRFNVGEIPDPVPCTAEGDPKPNITWSLEGGKELPPGVISNGNDTKNTGTMHTAYLTFLIGVTSAIKGKYVCTASNVADTVLQTLDVDVVETAGGLVVAVVSAVIAILILVAIVIFLYRRLILQRKIIKQFLSEKEVEEFFYGNPEMLKSKNDGSLPETSQFLPYKKEYEILPTSIQIEDEKVLGSGQYGMVYQGKLAIDNEEKRVAVKTVKPSADKEYVKALLSEIKIMMTLGGHPSIVNFIGAITQDIRDGKLLIVVEFCANGSLEKYLRQHRNSFVDLVQNDAVVLPMDLARQSISMRLGSSINTKNLITWAYEVAAGMEYLNQKKVIHADLACRNILVTDEKTVKITDFGLSRQLYESSDYVKKTQVPLPWRWMAVESLKDMSFSAQSDIWAYGVTLWEMFSLGAIPYPGYNWDTEFLRKLESGLRVDKPEYATTKIYQMMLRCMEYDPGQRISFAILRKCFYQMIVDMGNTRLNGYADISLI